MLHRSVRSMVLPLSPVSIAVLRSGVQARACPTYPARPAAPQRGKRHGHRAEGEGMHHPFGPAHGGLRLEGAGWKEAPAGGCPRRKPVMLLPRKPAWGALALLALACAAGRA